MGISQALGVIVDNYSLFDGLILALFVAVFVIYIVTSRKAKALFDKLHRMISIPYHNDGKAIIPKYTKDEIERIVGERDSAEKWYAFFVNGAAVFPLLGILGTVLSLIPMAADLGNIQSNFFIALTSTFWGLVFSIICKCLDAPLSAKMENNERNVTELTNSFGQAAEEPEA